MALWTADSTSGADLCRASQSGSAVVGLDMGKIPRMRGREPIMDKNGWFDAGKDISIQWCWDKVDISQVGHT